MFLTYKQLSTSKLRTKKFETKRKRNTEMYLAPMLILEEYSILCPIVFPEKNQRGNIIFRKNLAEAVLLSEV